MLCLNSNRGLRLKIAFSVLFILIFPLLSNFVTKGHQKYDSLQLYQQHHKSNQDQHNIACKSFFSCNLVRHMMKMTHLFILRVHCHENQQCLLCSIVKYSSFDVTSVHLKRLVVKPRLVKRQGIIYILVGCLINNSILCAF